MYSTIFFTILVTPHQNITPLPKDKFHFNKLLHMNIAYLAILSHHYTPQQTQHHLTIHNLFHRNHTPTLRIQRQSHHGNGRGNLLIARKGRGGNAAAAMRLEVKAVASIAFAGGSDAAAGEAGCSRLRCTRFVIVSVQ